MMNKLKAVVGNERGEFGIKQIAITVAVIIIIGVVVTTLSGKLPTWVGDIWDKFLDLIDKNIGK
ncbi:hypothetical protein [Paenibacillus aquistagni]|uniref:hypothetical protein n=1 Tax=Paenibacillus aquistagni TaxID=1852522 RepID=UPI0011323DF2|nr:hypothetical protein [Paenibacillus aquistagni]NMM55442.1 hypothetical protein [Paenibacillus aquistagni]